MPPKRTTRATSRNDKDVLAAISQTRDERRQTLGLSAISHLEQSDLDLAERWGVLPGSNEWVECMTRHCIAESLARDLPSQRGPMMTPETASAGASPSDSGSPGETSGDQGGENQNGGTDADSGEHGAMPSPSSNPGPDLPIGTSENPIVLESALRETIPAEEDGLRSGTWEEPQVSSSPLSTPPRSLSSKMAKPSPTPKSPPHRRFQPKPAAASPSPSRKRKAETEEPMESVESSPRKSKRASIPNKRYSASVSPTTPPSGSRRSSRLGSVAASSTLMAEASTTPPPDPTIAPTSTTPTQDPPAPRKNSNKDAPKIHKCSYTDCKYHVQGFSRKEHLKRHVKSIHEKGVVASCRGCSRAFGRSDNCKQHEGKCAAVLAMGDGSHEV